MHRFVQLQFLASNYGVPVAQGKGKEKLTQRVRVFEKTQNFRNFGVRRDLKLRFFNPFSNTVAVVSHALYSGQFQDSRKKGGALQRS